MRRVFKAFDSFVFNALDIMGRASRAEYWGVMPILWLVMLGLIWWDIRSVQLTLAAGEMPSFNPLTYGSFLMILLSAIPRLTLAMRRLQDSGRKAKWAFLPYTALLFGVTGLFGFAMSGALAYDTGYGTMPLMYNFGSAQGIAMAIHDILSNIENIRYVGQPPSEIASGLGTTATSGGAGMAVPMLILFGLLTIFPPIALFFYVLIMLSPSDEDENAYGAPTSFDHGPKETAGGEHNAFASYAILTKQNRKPTADEIAARKEAVHSLYEQRVLGRQQQ